MPQLPSKSLVRLARATAKAHAKAASLNRRWAEEFKKVYGHNDISDALVEIIDYCEGDVLAITAEFIAEHSAPGES
jgi:hypothetical protein